MTKTKKAYCLISFVLAVVVFLAVLISSLGTQHVYASEESDSVSTTSPNDEMLSDVSDTTNGLSITYNNETGSVSTPVKILLFLTIISVAPSLLIMLTSYTRIIIVLHFLRTAIGTQTSPPNQVMIGLALFLTFFIMWPTFKEINETAIQPLDNGEITMTEFFETAEVPLREFMYGQIQVKDVSLFIDISGEEYDIDFDEGSEAFDELPMTIIIPSFIIGELRQAFIMGFIIYIPFIVIDMVVASVLMSMGMMMLPPTTISLPFKILLFVLADGWNLVIGSLVQTFY
jgi:flagellar biosynthetic protein FliP